MANTYFKLKKSVITKNLVPYPDYTNNYELALTAFVGAENIVQLTVQYDSTIPNNSGVGYIVLNNEDIDKLIGALIERKTNIISATGYEQSVFCTKEDLD